MSAAIAVRRSAAAVIALTLIALVICDLTVSGLRAWSDRHSLTASVISNLMVLGVTVLIVDEVVARRQRRDRASTVAVQAIIVYGQATRAYNTVLARVDGPGSAAGSGSGSGLGSGSGSGSDEALDELRTLAGMLLTVSSSLFDDPQARLFLEQLQRLVGAMFATVLPTLAGVTGRPSRDSLVAGMAALRAEITPLSARLSPQDRTAISEPSPSPPPPSADDRRGPDRGREDV